MDKKFLKENNLLEAQKRFQDIVCYRYVIKEAENDEMPADPNGGMGMDDVDNGGQQDQMGMDGGEPQMNGGEVPMDGGMDNGPEGFDPNMGEQMPPMGDANGDEEVEEIEIDDLTDAQEDTDKHVKHVSKAVSELDDKFAKVIELIGNFESEIDATNKSIEDLKAEFEKRNPTNIEKMTLRSKRAYPFGETPEEFWEKKEAEGDYSTEDDMNGENDEKYKITKSDIDNITNWGDIYKSINDNSYHQSLSDLLGY